MKSYSTMNVAKQQVSAQSKKAGVPFSFWEVEGEFFVGPVDEIEAEKVKYAKEVAEEAIAVEVLKVLNEFEEAKVQTKAKSKPKAKAQILAEDKALLEALMEGEESTEIAVEAAPEVASKSVSEFDNHVITVEYVKETDKELAAWCNGKKVFFTKRSLTGWTINGSMLTVTASEKYIDYKMKRLGF